MILTFSQATIPTSLKAGYLNIAVQQYYPSPLRCFKCQRFGHSKFACKRSAICARCGSEEHGENPCGGPLNCINCKGTHTAYDKSCPVQINPFNDRALCTTHLKLRVECRSVAHYEQLNCSRMSKRSVLRTDSRPFSRSAALHIQTCQSNGWYSGIPKTSFEPITVELVCLEFFFTKIHTVKMQVKFSSSLQTFL